ncbi:hypothetical protein SXCC_01800 [Gluconacetobacter sp. SXCC-1]|nr:hypothetical protein SXCC_01800 [Gluconacetobacter sp. SXCC-1]
MVHSLINRATPDRSGAPHTTPCPKHDHTAFYRHVPMPP